MTKTSRFRHTTAQAAKADKHLLGVSPTGAIWDCANMLAANTQFVALPWQQMGTTAVFRLGQAGKLPANPPVLIGHGGNVIDLAFHPFDESLLFTASEDCSVRGWKIPDGGLTHNESAPAVTLAGHSKKVGIMAFHPSARNVLATASVDNTVHLWDVEAGASRATLKPFGDYALSLNFNLDGSLLSATTKDRKLVIADARTGAVVASADAHSGNKTARSVWAKRLNLIVTAGFDKRQHRQALLWDTRALAKPLHTEEVDQASSVFLPFYDEDLSVLYLGGKGDNVIKSFELTPGEAAPMLPCATYQSTDASRALAMLPKRALDVKQCEVGRFVKLGASKALYTVSLMLPRKQAAHEFQADVYVPTFAATPAMTAADFFAGVNAAPLLSDLRGLFDGTGVATADAPAPVAAPAKKADDTPAASKTEEEAAAAPPAEETAAAAAPAEAAPAPEAAPAADADEERKKAKEAAVGAAREAVAAATARVAELETALDGARQQLAAASAALAEAESSS